MTTQNSTTRGKRLIIALAGVGIVLGLSVAGILAAITSQATNSAHQTLEVATSTPTPTTTPTTAAPEPAPTVTAPASTVTPKPIHSTGTAIGPVHTTVTTGSHPKSTQTVTNSSSQVTVTPTKPHTTPAPKPTSTTPSTTAKACPSTRSENPSVWDACRAGYIAPSIEFSGIVSCTAVDRTAGTWKLVLKYAMVGGNYRSAQWAGLSNNAAGTSILTARGIKVDSLSSPTSIPLNATIYVGSMNGLPGDIDTVERQWDTEVTLGKYCS